MPEDRGSATALSWRGVAGARGSHGGRQEEPRTAIEPQPQARSAASAERHTTLRLITQTSAPSARLGEMPSDPDVFVGREDLVAHAAQMLRDPGVRLLTLIGPGGVGKTRAAHHIACRLGEDDPGLDVVLVSLVDVPGGDLPRLCGRLLLALGAKDNSDADPLAHLTTLLRRRALLLVLDNCEHLAEQVGDVAREVLAAAPHVRLLATSRCVLQVPGEYQVAVSPLACAAEDGQVPAAVRLLVERARTRGVTVDPTDPDVAKLVTMLDGMPLAIGIAAAHLDLMSLSEVLADLDDPDGMLDEAVQATMDWSYQLLSVDARRLWAVAALFPAGFTLAQARDVAARVGIAAAQASGALADLVRGSILTRTDNDGPARFRLLEPVRRFGLQIEDDQVDHDRIEQAHAEHVAEMTSTAARTWYGPREVATLRELVDATPQTQRALDYFLSQPETAHRGLELVVDSVSTRCHVWAGMMSEGRRQVTAAIAGQPDGPPTHAMLSALADAAWMTTLQGKVATSAALAEQARAVAAALGACDSPQMLRMEGTLLLHGDPADTAASVEVFTACADKARAAGTPGEEAVNRLLACMAAAFSHHPEAVERARAYLADTERAQAQWMLTWAQWAVAFAEYQRRRDQEAITMLRLAVTAQHGMGDVWGMAWSVWLCAILAASRDHQAAARLFGAATELRRVIDVQLGPPGLAAFVRVQSAPQAACLRALEEDGMADGMAAGAQLDYDEIAALCLTTLKAAAVTTLPGGLTDREAQVARLVAKGLTNREIAGQLTLSPRTVGHHVSHILTKTGCANRIELSTWVLRHLL